IGDYHGHTIWMDIPYTSGGDSYGIPADTIKQMYRHAMEKAMAMGVPFIFNGGATVGAEVAKELGYEAVVQDVTMNLDKGHTGLHQSEGIDSDYYFVHWPGLGGGYKEAPADSTSVALPVHAHVVMPKKAGE